MKRSYFLLFIFQLVYLQSQAQTEVTFYTNKGSFIVELYDWSMPITSGNFKSLVNAKFYDGVIFHRVINSFMIQGGDPTGTGSGGPGYTIPDEFVSGISNIQKTISMANSGPNTGGSQFFINLVNNTYLDFDKPPYTSAHPVFGIVTTNFSVVQAIGAVATNSADRPLVDVVMDSLRITKTGPLSTPQETMFISSMKVYPNPFNERSILELEVVKEGNYSLSLLSQTGEVLYTNNLSLKTGKHHLNMSLWALPQLANGNYYIGIQHSTQFMHHKLVVAN